MMLASAGSNHKRTLFLSVTNSRVHKVSSQSFKSDAVSSSLPLHCFFSLALEDVECQVMLTKITLGKSCGLEMRFPTSENYLIRVGKV